MITRPISYVALATAVALYPVYATAAEVSARAMGLGEILEITMQRQAADHTPPPFQSSSWLAALPSVGLSYLHSDEDLGTDETEVSLNLPLKSPYLRQQDKVLRSLQETLSSTEAQRRKLYFSGLIRESSWTWRIASTRADFAVNKIRLLQELLERQQVLFEAHASSRYNLLLIRQELADARIHLADQQLLADTWGERYRLLSGQGILPESLNEPPLPSLDAWQSHPELRLLDLGWQQQQALINANSKASSPWNLALQAKQLDSPGIDENQYGLALEIPLSVFDTAVESSNSEWRQASSNYWQQRDELQVQLSQSALKLQSEAVYLKRKQTLLEESASIGSELLDESRTLLGQNELGREIWVRRVLSDLDKQAEVAINQLRIGQNVAMSRQAAGIPL